MVLGFGMERRLFSDLEKALPEGIVRKRVIYLLKWYHKKAARYKAITYLATTLSILLPVSLTLLNTQIIKDLIGTERANCWLVILPIVNSAGAGFYAFFQSRNNWIRYRLAAENVKREAVLYANLHGGEENLDKTAQQEFLQKIENICAAEVQEWENLRRESQPEEKAAGSTHRAS